MSARKSLELLDKAVPLESETIEDQELDEFASNPSFNRGSSFQSKPASWKQRLHENKLIIVTFLAVVTGFVVGSILRAADSSPTTIKIVAFPGELLLRSLKMLVLPLVSASIICGLGAIGEQKSSLRAERLAFTRIGIYFLTTTFLAVLLGITFVSVIKPGSYVHLSPSNSTPQPTSSSSSQNISTLDSVLDVIRHLVPDNLVQAAAENNILGIIFFSLLLGGSLISIGSTTAAPLMALMKTVNQCVMKIVHLITWYAPLGITCLIAARMANTQNLSEVLSNIGMFGVTVMVGLAIHCFILLPCVYAVFLRRNPFLFYSRFSHAIVTAFGTDSSAATLPITIKCSLKAGITEKIAHIVLPLGVTLNMNGTALYEAVAALFVAQMHGIQLNLGQTIIVALTSTLAAIGAAGIPEAGLVTMTIVFSAVGLPLESIAILLTIDWFLDRCRTVVNVLGDVVGAAIVDSYYQKEAIHSYNMMNDLEDTSNRNSIASSGGSVLPPQR